MIKAVFFDIDGTLVNRQSIVTQSTVLAIQKAQEKGILCGVATGRSPQWAKPLIEKYGLDFAITYNGQYIFENGGKVLSARPFDKKVIRDLAQFGDEHNRDLSFGSATKMEGSTLLKVGNSNLVRLVSPIIPKEFALGLKNTWQHVIRRYKKANYQDAPILREPIYQVIMISPEKEEQEIRERFANTSITRSNPYSIDIIPKGGSKIKGIEIFCQLHGIDVLETMAFGDSWNDMEMLQGVGFGVAMGNAIEPLKEVADFVTTSNDKDGIARAFMQFGLLDEHIEEIEEVITELSMEDMLVSDTEGKEQWLIPVVEGIVPPKAHKAFWSEDAKFNQVKAFHQAMDDVPNDIPHVLNTDVASYRMGFKAEEIVEFLFATSDNDKETFHKLVEQLIADIHQSVEKIESKGEFTEDILAEQADAVVDLLYFTYGTFVLMGIDPHEIFQIVHNANMGKLAADGKPRFDEVTGKLLKPEGWEEKYAPEAKIREEIARQIAERLGEEQ